MGWFVIKNPMILMAQVQAKTYHAKTHTVKSRLSYFYATPLPSTKPLDRWITGSLKGHYKSEILGILHEARAKKWCEW